MRAPTIAHFVPLYLPRTETFIYQGLTHHRRYRPIVLAHHRVETATSFPLRHVYAEPELRARRGRPAWVDRSATLRRLLPPASFRQALRRHDARVLHVHFGQVGAEVLEVSRRFGIPQVTSFYGWDDTVAIRGESRAEKFARLFREGECFLVEGSHIARRLVALGCPSDKIRVHRIGIDVAAIPFSPPPPPGATEAVRLLLCGRMVEKKGHRFAVEALARARAAGFRAELRLIGDGPLRSSVEAQSVRC